MTTEEISNELISSLSFSKKSNSYFQSLKLGLDISLWNINTFISFWYIKPIPMQITKLCDSCNSISSTTFDLNSRYKIVNYYAKCYISIDISFQEWNVQKIAKIICDNVFVYLTSFLFHAWKRQSIMKISLSILDCGWMMAPEAK